MEDGFFSALFGLFVSEQFLAVFKFLWIFAPLWLPVVLFSTLIVLYLRFIRRRFIADQDYVLLEIRLPVEIHKSPLAMESVLSALHYGPGAGNWIKKYIVGAVIPWWSLEIVSIEGSVHFFVWTWVSHKNAVEAAFYSQYPTIEIAEVEDYTRNVNFEKGKTNLFVADFVLTESDAYPIKTYVDYKLDKDPKEEYKVDPLAPMIEFMGTIGPGEQIWYQILFQQDKSDWKDKALAEIENIKKNSKTQTGEYEWFMPTPSQREQMDAIERSVRKQGFQCGIRAIYYAEADKYRGSNLAPFLNAFKQFSSNELNGFSPARYSTIFDYPWQDFNEMRENKARREGLDAYRRRSWFHPPHATPSYVLTIEELATIFHLPGDTIQTPTISRISSKRSEAPANLPK